MCRFTVHFSTSFSTTRSFIPKTWLLVHGRSRTIRQADNACYALPCNDLLISPRGEQYGTEEPLHVCSTKKIMSSNINRPWVEAYLRAALEVDGQKMPNRIVGARESVAERLKDLEGNSDHHAERHEMQSALAVLTSLEDETRIWPTAAIAHSMKTLLPKLRNKNAGGDAAMTSSEKKV